MAETPGQKIGEIVDTLVTKDDLRASEERIISAVRKDMVEIMTEQTNRLRDDLNDAFAENGIAARMKSSPRR